MFEKAYIPGRSEFGGFSHASDPRCIPTYDALIIHYSCTRQFLVALVFADLPSHYLQLAEHSVSMSLDSACRPRPTISGFVSLSQ